MPLLSRRKSSERSEEGLFMTSDWCRSATTGISWSRNRALLTNLTARVVSAFEGIESGGPHESESYYTVENKS